MMDPLGYVYARLGAERGVVVLLPGKDGVLEAQIFLESEKEAKAVCRCANEATKRSLETKLAIQKGRPFSVELQIRHEPIHHRQTEDAR